VTVMAVDFDGDDQTPSFSGCMKCRPSVRTTEAFTDMSAMSHKIKTRQTCERPLSDVR
jgi:hypothetical protein